MIWLMIKPATKPPIMLPSPPSTHIMKVIGPKELPTNGGTSYCSTKRHEARAARSPEARTGEKGEETVDRVHAAHDQLGIGNPHHIDDPEDQVEAERQQRQDAAEQHSVQHRFKEVDVH